MTITDLYHAGIEIESEVVYCYYNYNSNRRVPISRQKAREKEIKYIYCENNILYIEVDME